MIEPANGRDDKRSGPQVFKATLARCHFAISRSGVEVAAMRGRGASPLLDRVVEPAPPTDPTPMNTSYSYPVSQLLTLGQSFEEVDGRPETWKAYAKLGVDNRHTPELMAVVADEALHTGSGLVPFAPVHAWRILGALKATEALPALVSLLRRIDDDFDDWIATELPCVFSQMGGQSVDVLAPFAADSHNGS